MKRMVCLAALTLLPCFGIATVCSSPVRADGGGSSAEMRVRINLTGPAIMGRRPEGHAEFRTAGTQRQLNVEAEKVNMADGTMLTVKVNGAAVGMLTLTLGHGAVELKTKNGAAVPAIKKGDIVTVVTATGAVVENGTF